jgi:hypothetical protein
VTVGAAAARLGAVIAEPGVWHADAGQRIAALITRLPEVAKEMALARCDGGRLSGAPAGVLAPALAARCKMCGEPPLRTLALPYDMLTSVESARSVAEALGACEAVQRLTLAGIACKRGRGTQPMLRLSHARELAAGLAGAPSLCALRLEGVFESEVQRVPSGAIVLGYRALLCLETFHTWWDRCGLVQNAAAVTTTAPL